MQVSFSGTHWQKILTTGIITHPTATGLYPPSTGWPDGIDVDYARVSMIKADGSTKWVWADLLAHENMTEDMLMQYLCLGADDACHLAQWIIYMTGTMEDFTEEECTEAEQLIADGCITCGTGTASYAGMVHNEEPIVYNSEPVIHI